MPNVKNRLNYNVPKDAMKTFIRFPDTIGLSSLYKA